MLYYYVICNTLYNNKTFNLLVFIIDDIAYDNSSSYYRLYNIGHERFYKIYF